MKKLVLVLVTLTAIAAPIVATTGPADASVRSRHQAVGAAKDYLRFEAFSRQGLIDQLDSRYGSGFSKADATYAVNHIKVSWSAQAVKSAKSYLRYMHFSRAGLIQQLSSPYGSKFTYGQAVYAVNRLHL